MVGNMTNISLDNYDLAILKTLEQNGRITVTELAERVGLSKTPCQIRMKRLESNGVIRGYTVIMDYGLLDTNHIAFVQVKLSDTRAAALASFNDAVGAVSEIEECHMMAADFDYILKCAHVILRAIVKCWGKPFQSCPMFPVPLLLSAWRRLKSMGKFLILSKSPKFL